MDQATAANQQTTAACLHTRSLPAASTRRGVAGSTSAEYESERKEKTNRRRTNHTKSDGEKRNLILSDQKESPTYHSSTWIRSRPPTE